MFVKRVFLLVLLAASALPSFSQNKFTISGTIKDSASGEALIGVVASVKELPTTGANTNEYGFYSLTLPEGNYTLVYFYLGYRPDSIKISLHQNIKQNLRLGTAGKSLEEVKVKGKK